MPHGTRYKNRPKDEWRQTVSLTLSVREMRGLDYLAKLQQITRAELLRRALESYARSALTVDERHRFYPPGQG